jgi:NADPH:quinone reductase-like Zn-dependent oxidoreductase
MAWQNIRIARFGGPEVLELTEQATIPVPGPGEVRIEVLAAGTGFTDTFIRRGARLVECSGFNIADSITHADSITYATVLNKSELAVAL